MIDEFALIDTFFKTISNQRQDVVFGVGDDAACLEIPDGMNLLVSCDTLLADVHFLNSWNAYDIACKAVMVNVSDIAAMGGIPSWLTLALSLPSIDEQWLKQFSRGLQDSLNQYNVALVGGDTTRGALSMTLTIHGLVPKGKAVRRSGAAPGDIIYVSGDIGAAALAVAFLNRQGIEKDDKSTVMQKLIHPVPRIDLSPLLQDFATAAIDISDGLGADLNHICVASKVGACIDQHHVPIHPLVKKYQGSNALDFALSGGDDYELCFTIAPENEKHLSARLTEAGLRCYPIGVIEAKPGMRLKTMNGECELLQVSGYNHF